MTYGVWSTVYASSYCVSEFGTLRSFQTTKSYIHISYTPLAATYSDGIRSVYFILFYVGTET